MSTRGPEAPIWVPTCWVFAWAQAQMSDNLVKLGPTSTGNMTDFQRLSRLPAKENSPGERRVNTGRGLRSQGLAVCFPGDEQKGQKLVGVSSPDNHNDHFK